MEQAQPMYQLVTTDGTTQTLTHDEFRQYYPDIYASQVFVKSPETYQLQYVLNTEGSKIQQTYQTTSHQVMLQATDQQGNIINQVGERQVLIDQSSGVIYQTSGQPPRFVVTPTTTLQQQFISQPDVESQICYTQVDETRLATTDQTVKISDQNNAGPVEQFQRFVDSNNQTVEAGQQIVTTMSQQPSQLIQTSQAVIQTQSSPVQSPPMTANIQYQTLPGNNVTKQLLCIQGSPTVQYSNMQIPIQQSQQFISVPTMVQQQIQPQQQTQTQHLHVNQLMDHEVIQLPDGRQMTVGEFKRQQQRKVLQEATSSSVSGNIVNNNPTITNALLQNRPGNLQTNQSGKAPIVKGTPPIRMNLVATPNQTPTRIASSPASSTPRPAGPNTSPAPNVLNKAFSQSVRTGIVTTPNINRNLNQNKNNIQKGNVPNRIGPGGQITTTNTILNSQLGLANRPINRTMANISANNSPNRTNEESPNTPSPGFQLKTKTPVARSKPATPKGIRRVIGSTPPAQDNRPKTQCSGVCNTLNIPPIPEPEPTPAVDEVRTARMLVMLENGEQRLITFSLPKEACAPRDLMEQVLLQVSIDYKPGESEFICCTHENSEIEYLVQVIGNKNKLVGGKMPVLNCQHPSHFQQNATTTPPKATTPISRPPPQHQPSPNLSSQSSFQDSFCKNLTNAQQTKSHKFVKTYPAATNPLSEKPDLKLVKEPSVKEEDLPRYIEGMMALCSHCGYLSQNFNHCERCKRKLVNPKAIAKTKRILEPAEKTENKNKIIVTVNKKPNRKVRVKCPEPEMEVLTLSSDDEEGSDSAKKQNEDASSLRTKLGFLEKEPLVAIYDNPPNRSKSQSPEEVTTQESNVIVLKIRTVRVGTWKTTPTDDIQITKQCFSIPLKTRANKSIILKIEVKGIAKILMYPGKAVPMLFLYSYSQHGPNIREQLGMKDDCSEPDYYFDPVSKAKGTYRRIVLIAEEMTDEDLLTFKEMFSNILGEVTHVEAQEILFRCSEQAEEKKITNESTNKENDGTNTNNSSGAATSSRRLRSQNTSSLGSSQTKTSLLFVYPPKSKGAIPVSSEDYACLATDVYLNDVIIDFYLRYLINHTLTEAERTKYHVCSTFFYKRLTAKPQMKKKSEYDFEYDAMLSAAQKRHKRVSRWTRNINIFEKDFIIIPINEAAHWFLAIICFPGLTGAFNIHTNKPVDINKVKEKKIVKRDKVKSDTTVITMTEDEEERDEAEGSDSDLEQGESDEDGTTDEQTPSSQNSSKSSDKSIIVNPNAIKQPCILIFDSLASGSSRSRVVATLRDYLTWEHREKFKSNMTFNKFNMRGHCPKVPQQNNFTDCGLYLVQYVESFITDPIKDYNIPIKQLKDWFEEFKTIKKREDIALLIRKLMNEYGVDHSVLPTNINFPTENGVLLPDRVKSENDDSFKESNHGSPTASLSPAPDEEDEASQKTTTDKDEDNTSDLDESQTTPNDPVNKDKTRKQIELKLICKKPISTNISPGIKRKANDGNSQHNESDKLKTADNGTNSSEGGCAVRMSEGLLSICSNYSDKKKSDVMSYLKSKRIVRHKNTENSSSVDVKKMKMDSAANKNE